jgi:hypothetical protein
LLNFIKNGTKNEIYKISFDAEIELNFKNFDKIMQKKD